MRREFYIVSWIKDEGVPSKEKVICHSSYDTFEEALHCLEYYADERCGYIEETSYEYPKYNYMFYRKPFFDKILFTSEKIFIKVCHE